MWIKLVSAVVVSAALSAGVTYTVTTHVVSDLRYDFAGISGLCASNSVVAEPRRLSLGKTSEQKW